MNNKQNILVLTQSKTTDSHQFSLIRPQEIQDRQLSNFPSSQPPHRFQLPHPHTASNSHTPTRFSTPTLSHGFSLIELIMVIAILGIIGATAYPKMSEFYDNIRVSQAVKTLAMDIEYAQTYARTHMDTVYLVIDPDNESYSVFAGENENNLTIIPHPQENTDFLVKFGEGYYTPATISSTSFTNPANTIVFDEKGFLCDSGYVKLNDTRTITLEPETGKITVN